MVEVPSVSVAAYALELGFKNVKSLARHYNINKNTIYTRLRSGMPIEQALTLSVKVKEPVPFHRKQAARTQQVKYEGKPCKEGHTVRYVKNDLCVECSAAYGAKWRKDNEHILKAPINRPPRKKA